MKEFVEPQMERIPFDLKDVIASSAEPTEAPPTNPHGPETPPVIF